MLQSTTTIRWFRLLLYQFKYSVLSFDRFFSSCPLANKILSLMELEGIDAHIEWFTF